ncbi:hypothetical protein [Stenotrophomonas geniculata]|uniref:hypothetical protein n=1 Tax=Stenotrophomonas geniculata TaxID=86188 RepID=UPI00070AB19C|nr:hypothetical protein [Stenotrophomonas geniculata]KRG43838.1 hypothetical protein ARC63_09205 [Stenotrophomonas geniculata ATCC 19374 = JCM 13324]CAH0064126.1 conserved exported protein of unknown function [Stenotrophomonas maltophilia]HCL43464.1 hypothetical protein [Pseudomonas sp.]
MRIASVMVVLTIWLGACGEAVAKADSIPPTGTKQGWERQHLGDHVSEPGEALPDFLRRTGAALRDFTRRTGHEACGALARDGQRFSYRLYTDGVPHGCAVFPSQVLPGFTYTGETFHSHPTAAVIELDRAGRAWSRHYGVGVQHLRQALPIRNRWHTFSPEDFAGGPGWLVAGNRLLHQRGENEVTRHGRLSP